MGLFKKKPKDTSVYGQLKNQTPSESIRYRDVYENQQIKRSKIGSAGSMTARKVFVIICAVGAFIAGWGVMSGVQWIGAQMTGAGPASYCAEVQIDMNARYQEALKAAQEAYANGEVVEETPSEDESSVDESVESEQPTVVDVDTDGDGERDSVDMDDDNDVLVDTLDPDDDNDGIPDTEDPDWFGDTGASIGTGSQMGVSESYTIDYDGDGVEDTLFVGEDMVPKTADDYYEADVNDDGRIELVFLGQYYVKLEEGEEVPVDENGNPVEPPIYREDDYHAYKIGDIERDVTPGADLEFGTQDDIVVLSRNDSIPGLGYYVGLGGLSILKVLICLAAFAIAYSLLMAFMKKNWEAQNVMYDTADINQWENDQHIQVPEEIQENYDWFPDVGAHSPVQVSSLISHMALTNKGLKSIKVTRRADKDIRDESGQIVYYKGEALVDDDGVELTHKKPMIDEKFMDELWDASLLPPDKTVRRKFDPNAIPYNPGNKSREKLKDAETVADMINKYWTFPSYEPQRPGGAYIVDTEPVNTMVLAITRAGKGQTLIEPTLDMWTREMNPNNMVINDPKGELLVKFYVRGTVRGFQIIQFNLINAMKTDIYNPLGIAAEAAREGDFTKCALYVENIADVFFPLDGGDDPVWPNAANNAFKRAAYGLIDYYLEEEAELRQEAERTGMSQQILETKIDQMWGKVTLYNCYQLFVQLTAKKLKNPITQLDKKQDEVYNRVVKINKALGYDLDEDGNMTPNGQGAELSASQRQALEEELDELEYWLSEEGQAEEVKKLNHMSMLLWEDKPEADLLTLYFNATAGLPRNSMRRLIDNANNALRSMGAAEKMLASVYGIAITAMSFFTDPTISTLTSGTLSQNVDLGGLSFPRRFGVRFNPEFVAKYSLLGMQCRWESFSDKNFTKSLGKDFTHEDTLNREGWAMYYFKGIYPEDIAYLRLQIVDPGSEMLIRSFYFRFKKDYQKSLDGRYYMTDPVTGQKIVKNGILTEMVVAGQTSDLDGNVTTKYKVGKTTFPQRKVVDPLRKPEPEPVETLAIMRHMVRYAEKPKMVFLVTPPHLIVQIFCISIQLHG